MNPSDAQDWLTRTRSKAEVGDPKAQMDLALAYWHGRVVPRELDTTLRLLRSAEEKLGEAAWIEIIRVLFFEDDSRIEDVFEERKLPSNGEAYFIFGKYLIKNGKRQEAKVIYSSGAELGHIGCEIQFHKLTHSGFFLIFGLPRLLSILKRGFVVAWKTKK